METEKYYAIITAGGSGNRMHSDLPKQFIEIEGKSILHRTIEKFLETLPKVNIILVMNLDYRNYWIDYCEKKDFIFPHVLCAGGITRFHSVKNGLKYVEEEDALVAVHDAVRPFIDRELILSLFHQAEKTGAAVPLVEMSDSLRKRNENGQYQAFSREGIASVQTPQVFLSGLLKSAYEQPYQLNFTDDASVVEAAGHPLSYVDGLSYNLKITRPADLKIAQALVHSFTENRD